MSSTREKVAALWQAKRKAWQIAEILGISERKVFYHLRILRDQNDPRAHSRPQWANRWKARQIERKARKREKGHRPKPKQHVGNSKITLPHVRCLEAAE